jgi:PmbA protein
MLDRITSALERHPDIAGWTVRLRRSRSTQLYLIGATVENVREVVTEDYEVEVLNDHPWPNDSPPAGAAGGGQPPHARGAATVKLVSADRDRIQERIDDAVLMARLVNNPPYDLPGPAEYPTLDLADPLLVTAASATGAASAFADELWGLIDKERPSGVRISAAELFLTYTELELHNSRGIQIATAATRAMAELALLARGGDGGSDEAEHFRQIEARRLADLRLSQQVAEAAQFTRDTLRARPPQTRTGPVVLSGDALIPLFEPFLFQASASAAYTKLAAIEVGQSVYGERPPPASEPPGDRLNLRSNALRPYALGSHAFDADGVPGQDVSLIEDGVLRARHATQRYAQYLGIPATGQPGTTEVAAGATPLTGLLGAEPVYHVVTFSAPDVDPVTGDFGSEIRLGYEVTGGEARPIKGGSVAGNVFEAFADACFSRELLERGEYAGPHAVRFASLRVAGEG